MLLAHLMVSSVLLGTIAFGAGNGHAQDFPNKPIRFVTDGAGTGNDFMARLVAQGISGSLGQPVIVDNRSPSDRPVAMVIKAPPDGHTLLVTGGSLWNGPLLRKTFYDPLKDFSPVTTITREVMVLVVSPSLPVTSTKELIAYAMARPGALNYGSASSGGSGHLAGELFKLMAGINIVRVAHKSSSAALTSVMGGEVQMMLSSTGTAMPHVKSGRVKALAVGSAKQSPLAPGLPTVAATVPGYEATSLSGLFAPASTSAAIKMQLSQQVTRYLATAEAGQQFLNVGLEAVGGSPEEFATAIKADMMRVIRLVKEAGIRVDE
jgi:tripartite-type tricarboxylate transporter receptor subunit TctC